MFKKGDKVRCIRGYGTKLIEDSTYTVRENYIIGDMFLNIEEQGNWYANRFELVKPAKEAIAVGDRVRIVDSSCMDEARTGDTGAVSEVRQQVNVVSPDILYVDFDRDGLVAGGWVASRFEKIEDAASVTIAAQLDEIKSLRNELDAVTRQLATLRTRVMQLRGL